ncbi:MAG: hypothetical protein JRC92_02825 [Deltaproteobacteria bacterium]|nr:hypothetical protein [Deltaproteobacteria bacterium]
MALALGSWGAASAWAKAPELSLAVRPDKVQTGETVRIEIRLRQVHAAPSEAVRVTVWADEEIIFQEMMPGLGPNETYVHSFNWASKHKGRVLIEAQLEDRPGSAIQVPLQVEASVPGRFDLGLSWAEAPQKVCLGQGPWTAQVIVTNMGQVVSAAGRLALAINGRLVSWANFPPLNPGQQLWLSFTFSQARRGTNTLAAYLEGSAAEEDLSPEDNRVVQSFTLVERRPDLVPISLRILGPVEAGRLPLRAEAVIANRGGREARRVRVRFLVNRLEVKSLLISQLKPGQKRPVSLTWMPPQSGTYWLRVEADVERGVLEADEANNFRETKFTTLEARPDLSVRFQGLGSNQCLGKDPLKIQAVVRNSGRKASPATEVILRHGYDRLASRPVGPLAPGEAKTVDFFWIPERTGSHRLYLIVDPQGLIDEANEDNNDQSRTVNLRDCRPSLSAQPHGLKEVVHLGPDQPPFSLRVVNQGLSRAEEVSLILKIDGQEVERKKLDDISRGQAKVVAFDWRPKKIGTHLVEMIVDPEERIDEANRSDNTISVLIEFRGPINDLEVVGLATEPAKPVVGRPYEIKAQVANHGPKSVHDLEVIFLVNGETVSRTAIEIVRPGGQRKITALAPPLTPGPVKIMVQVDPDNRYQEMDETNNALELELQAGP